MTKSLSFNPLQKRATNPQKNVWVSASAGSGKTKVLVDRIISLLLSGVAPHKILCLTFTRAATAEMKQRLIQKLTHWSRLNTQDLAQEIAPYIHDDTPSQDYLQRAQLLFSQFIEADDSVRILTIHGFCQMILQKFSCEANLAPGFGILDEYRSQDILMHLQRNILQSSENKEVLQSMNFLMQNFSLSQCEEYLNTLMTLQWRHWLNDSSQQTQGLNPAFEGIKDLNTHTLSLRFMQKSLEHVQTIYSALKDQELSGNDKKAFVKITGLVNANDNVDLYRNTSQDLFLTQTGLPRLKVLSQTLLKSVPQTEKPLERFLEIFDQYKELWNLRHVYEVAESLSVVAHEISTQYNNIKSTMNVLDYDDLIYRAVNLLESSSMTPWVLYKLDGGIDHILVDEAQDTNHHQWRVVHAILQEFYEGEGQSYDARTLFVVGDIKQSIYSFQGADPHSFLLFREYYEEKIQSAGYEWLDIPLNISYRTTQAVLDVVDQTFTHPLASKSLFLESNQLKHIAFRSEQWGQVTLWPLKKPSTTPSQDFWDLCTDPETSLSSYSDLAEHIARTIAEWFATQKPLVNKNRPIQPSDIMILVQRRHDFTTELQKALSKYNIPYAGVDKINWQEHQCFRDLLILAKAALLPYDSLSLATVLKGPLYLWTDNDLFNIRKNSDHHLWQQLESDKRGAAVIRDFVRIKQWAHSYEPVTFFRKILYEGGGLKKFTNVYGHETNNLIDNFLNAIEAQHKESFLSLQDFVNWADTADFEFMAPNQDQTRQGVRIMTVHAAKGLQAPIVILPDTMRIASDISNLCMWQEDNFESLLWIPSEKILPKALKPLHQRLQDETVWESYRLLYVAMTRAEDELIVCGWELKRTNNHYPTWYHLIQKALLDLGAQTQEDGSLVFQKGISPSFENRTLLNPAIENLPIPPPTCNVSLNYKPIECTWLATPSSLDQSYTFTWDDPHNTEARFIGITVHRLLEILPQYPQSEWIRILQRLLIADDLRNMVLKILHNSDFQWIFGSNTYPEVTIHGDYKNLHLSAVLDRVGFDEHRIWCIDYKTSTQIPPSSQDIPLTYKIQMGAYGYLLRQLYPQKAIDLYILWTHTGQLMKLNHDEVSVCFENSACNITTAL